MSSRLALEARRSHNRCTDGLSGSNLSVASELDTRPATIGRELSKGNGKDAPQDDFVSETSVPAANEASVTANAAEVRAVAH